MTSTENIWETARKIGWSKYQVMMNIKILDSHSVMFWGENVEETKKYLETLKKIFETISDNKYVINVLGHIFSNKVTHFELKKIEK